MRVTFYDVKLSDLRKKVEAYKTLFDVDAENLQVSVKGTFTDKSGEIYFLMHKFYALKLSKSGSKYLYIYYNGDEATCMTPDDGIIQEIKLDKWY